MYSNNNEISDRQIFRQIIISILPLQILFFPAVTWKLGLIGSSIAGIILWLITISMVTLYNKILKKKRMANAERRKAGKQSKWVSAVKFFVKIRYVVLAAVCIMVLIRASKDLLLNEMNSWVILIFTAIVIYYFQCHSDEVFSRFVETVFVLIIIPVVISVILGIGGIDYKVIDGSDLINTELGRMSPKEIILLVVISIFSFVPCSALLVKDVFAERVRSNPGNIIKAFSVSWIICLVTNGVLWLQPSEKYMADAKYPFLTMLKTIGIPGGFMERQEALFGMFLIMALIIQAGTYLKVCTDKDKKKKSVGWILVAAVTGLLIFTGLSGDTDDLLLKSSLFTGKDVEDREYVLSMGIDVKESKYKVTFSIENSDNKIKTYEGETFDEVIGIYKDECEKMVDFTHVKLVVLGEELYEGKDKDSTDRLKELEKYFRENNIGLNVILCKCSSSIDNLVNGAENITSDFGIYVSSLLAKDGYDIYNIAYIFGFDTEETEDIIRNKVPEIQLREGVPVVKEVS